MDKSVEGVVHIVGSAQESGLCNTIGGELNREHLVFLAGWASWSVAIPGESVSTTYILTVVDRAELSCADNEFSGVLVYCLGRMVGRGKGHTTRLAAPVEVKT